MYYRLFFIIVDLNMNLAQGRGDATGKDLLRIGFWLSSHHQQKYVGWKVKIEITK
jgi:hypothetical protein